MKREIDRSNLESFVKEFNEKHETRPVTLRLFRGTTQLIEGEGIPLIGLDMERKPLGVIDVEIMMGGDGGGHLIHRVDDVNRVVVETGKGNRESRLLLEGRDGEQAILGLS